MSSQKYWTGLESYREFRETGSWVLLFEVISYNLWLKVKQAVFLLLKSIFTVYFSNGEIRNTELQNWSEEWPWTSFESFSVFFPSPTGLLLNLFLSFHFTPTPSWTLNLVLFVLPSPHSLCYLGWEEERPWPRLPPPRSQFAYSDCHQGIKAYDNCSLPRVKGWAKGRLHELQLYWTLWTRRSIVFRASVIVSVVCLLFSQQTQWNFLRAPSWCPSGLAWSRKKWLSQEYSCLVVNPSRRWIVFWFM